MKHLIEKFESAETTRDEERRLFDAFAPGHDVGPELDPYREMMQWYAMLEQSEKAAQRPARGSLLRMRLTRVISAAAAVALLVTVGIGFINRYQAQQRLALEFGNSYVMVNGVKSTDLDDIMPELERAEQLIDAKTRAIDARLQAGISKAENAGRESSDNPRIQALYNEFYSDN